MGCWWFLQWHWGTQWYSKRSVIYWSTVWLFDNNWQMTIDFCLIDFCFCTYLQFVSTLYFVREFIRLWCWLCWQYNEASLFCLILFVGLQGRFPIFCYNSSQRILFLKFMKKSWILRISQTVVAVALCTSDIWHFALQLLVAVALS